MEQADQSETLAGLIEACATGDRDAFRDLYGHSARYVFGIVLGILKDHDAARDVAQEAYVRIWKRASQFRAGAGSPKAWIGSIARNCAIDRLRSERARGFVQYVDEVPEFDDGKDIAGQTLDAMVLRQQLNSLRPEYRKALLLCYFQGYTYQELASVLDVPEGTAKSWVRRGLAALKEAMA
jgi:RNA polymerase sigma-70 factor (ECF subfamily)